MKRIFAQIFVVLVLAAVIAAQTENRNPELVDEFETVSLDDLMARLDRLIAEFSKNPAAVGHLRIYGGNEKDVSIPYRRGSLYAAYLKNNRQVSAEKFSIDFCLDGEEKSKTEFYVISPGDKLPGCKKNPEPFETTLLFEKILFYYPKIKLLSLENQVIYIEGSPYGDYSATALDRFKKYLNSNSQSKIYVIVYLQTNFEEDENGKTIAQNTKSTDKKTLAAKMLQVARKELIAKGFNAAQIETIDGGYIHDTRRLEFWFVPPGGEIPKPKPDYIPKKSSKK